MIQQKEFNPEWRTEKEVSLVALIPFTYSPREEVVATIMAGFKDASYYMRSEDLGGVIYWVVKDNRIAEAD